MQSLGAFDAVLKDVHREGKPIPLKSYFKGHGEDVHRKMKNKYGARADEVFYATANKTGMKPGRKSKADVKDSMRKVMRGRGGKHG